MKHEEHNLSKKVALVTGSSRGIGKAITLTLAQAGYTVIGTATSEKGVSHIFDYLNEKQLLGQGKILDISDKGSIEALFLSLESDDLMPDIIVNNAAITKDNLLLRMNEIEWKNIIDTDLTSLFYICKRVIRPMLKKKWGRIINISSVSGCVGLPGQTNYSAAKAGMIGFSKALAKELAPRHITVNVVAPGFIQSDMTENLPEAYKKTLLSQIPMNRMGLPEEVAAAVAFLALETASYITGQVLHINGGLYA